jgi:SAM-dependent methyltransferase
MALDQLGDVRGLRILELGGGGPNARLLALRKWGGAAVCAIDYSPTAIELLTSYFAANEERLEGIEGDFLTHDFGSRRFDVITHWGVLEHFEDPGPILARSAQLLAPGGRTLFTMPNMLAWAAALWRAKAPENWSVHVLHLDEAIAAACEAAPLRLERRFHAGLPFVFDTSWEWRGPVAGLLRSTQRGIGVGARWLPLYSMRGPRISKERGFLASAALAQGASAARGR